MGLKMGDIHAIRSALASMAANASSVKQMTDLLLFLLTYSCSRSNTPLAFSTLERIGAASLTLRSLRFARASFVLAVPKFKELKPFFCVMMRRAFRRCSRLLCALVTCSTNRLFVFWGFGRSRPAAAASSTSRLCFSLSSALSSTFRSSCSMC